YALAGRRRRKMEDGGEKWEFVKLPALAEGDAETRRPGDAESEPPASAGGSFEEAGTTKQHEITKEIKKTENPRSAISDPQSTGPHAIPNPRSADPLGRSEGEA